MRVISASEASRTFSAVLDQAERGETIVVTRGGRRVAMIVPTGRSNGADVVAVLNRWSGRLGDPDEFERSIDDARAVASAQDDRDPWSE